MRKIWRSVPSIIWWISIVSLIVPVMGEFLLTLVISHELLWFITLLPTFFFAYYFGLKGGLITILITTAINGWWELAEYWEGDIVYGEMVIFMEVSLVRVSLAMGIGLLADKLKHNQTLIATMAYHDALTGLPNRRLLNERLAEEINLANLNQQMLAVMYIDLDGFKFVNDAYSHAIGDLLLKSVSKRLKQCVRNTDTVSRQGGDEFVIILSNISHEETALLAQHILEALSQPFILDDNEIHMTTSIGIAFHPQYGSSEQNLLRHADIALHRAKEEGKNLYKVFDLTMYEKDLNRVRLEKDLRKALDRDEFVLYYQPQIHPSSGRIFGVEALLRWNHSKLGVISPADFITLSEETGLIIPIGEWVLREACRQIKAWQDAGFPPMSVGVNISARQFQQNHMIEAVAHALAQTELEPRYLNLEITESVAMHNEEQNLIKLNALKELGIRISIDDFGTGYSSLSYLKKFPIDMLKIDRSFITELTNNAEDTAIVIAVIALSHSLGLQVLAEGVETKQQLEFLQAHCCDYIQGYYYSKPLSVSDFEQMYIGLNEAAAATGKEECER